MIEVLGDLLVKKYVKILALHRHQCFFSAKGPPDTEMQCDAAPEDWEMRRSARTWGRSTYVGG